MTYSKIYEKIQFLKKALLDLYLPDVEIQDMEDEIVINDKYNDYCITMIKYSEGRWRMNYYNYFCKCKRLTEEQEFHFWIELDYTVSDQEALNYVNMNDKIIDKYLERAKKNVDLYHEVKEEYNRSYNILNKAINIIGTSLKIEDEQ